jgi:hypothetical protein
MRLMLIVHDGRAMSIQIITHRDALCHAAGHVAVAVTMTVILTWSLSLTKFGADPNAMVSTGYVTKSGIMIGVIISALLSVA